MTVVTGDADLGVDVEHTLATTWGPDSGDLVNLVGVGVVLAHWATEDGLGGGLVGLAREVVSGLLDTLLSTGKAGVSAVGGGEDGVLPATWVLKVDVQLAVLAGVSDWNTWSKGSDVFIEDKGESGSVAGDLVSDGASWAASSTSADTGDPNLGWIWASLTFFDLNWSSRGESKESGGDESSGELHFECWFGEGGYRKIFKRLFG